RSAPLRIRCAKLRAADVAGWSPRPSGCAGSRAELSPSKRDRSKAGRAGNVILKRGGSSHSTDPLHPEKALGRRAGGSGQGRGRAGWEGGATTGAAVG